MKYEVSEEARRATSKCLSSFSCLTGEKLDLCAVEKCVNGQVHLLTCRHNGNCSYRHPFGQGDLCMCPVRKELFNKYQI